MRKLWRQDTGGLEPRQAARFEYCHKRAVAEPAWHDRGRSEPGDCRASLCRTRRRGNAAHHAEDEYDKIADRVTAKK